MINVNLNELEEELGKPAVDANDVGKGDRKSEKEKMIEDNDQE